MSERAGGEKMPKKNEEKDNSMTDEEWNAWIEPVVSWVENINELTLPEGLELEDIEDMIPGINSRIRRGNRDPQERKVHKGKIQNMGNDLPEWPHTRGPGTSLTSSQQTMLSTALAVREEADTAAYQIYVQHKAQHILVRRASKKNQTLGLAYESMEQFIEAGQKAEAARVKALFKNNEWATKDDDGNIVEQTFESPVVRIPSAE